MKVKLLALILALIMTMCMFSGCKEGKNTGTTTDTTTSDTSAPITTEVPDTDYIGVYDDLLFDIYKHILAITYDAEHSDSMDGDAGFREVVGGLSEEDALRAIGYTQSDINSDGVPELLIYLIDDNGNEKCAGTRILAAYTVKNNTPTLIFEGASRNRYYLLTNGIVYNEGSSGAAYSIFGTYTLEPLSDSLSAKNFYFTSPIDNNYNNIGFFENRTGSIKIDESIRFNGTESDFWQIQTDYSKRIAESELKPFEVFSAGDGTEEVSCVTAVFVEDTLVELTSAERFTADSSDYETEVVFFANYGDVYDFEFCEIKWLDDSDSGESDFEFVPVYKTETLTQDTPLVVTMTFWGDMPSYGIRYTDSEGTEHSGTISTSGMDGSLILDVI
ncbi:MAG: hypothetical protein E7563_07925 [Ruminococcaceae bacterium]|nr:hypothetical protein [Oscillospiraceae bacterium]